jgi:hypothetical protein
MADVFKMTLGNGAAEVAIEYLTSNNKITNIRWSIEVGYAATVKIWNTDVSTVDPIYQDTYGAGVGAEKVPGNHTVEIVNDPEIGDYLKFPDNLIVEAKIRSV